MSSDGKRDGQPKVAEPLTTLDGAAQDDARVALRRRPAIEAQPAAIREHAQLGDAGAVQVDAVDRQEARRRTPRGRDCDSPS